MKFDRSNKFDLCYYGQVNSLGLKSSVALKWANKPLWGYHLFCSNGDAWISVACMGFVYLEYTYISSSIKKFYWSVPTRIFLKCFQVAYKGIREFCVDHDFGCTVLQIVSTLLNERKRRKDVSRQGEGTICYYGHPKSYVFCYYGHPKSYVFCYYGHPKSYVYIVTMDTQNHMCFVTMGTQNHMCILLLWTPKIICVLLLWTPKIICVLLLRTPKIMCFFTMGTQNHMCILLLWTPKIICVLLLWTPKIICVYCYYGHPKSYVYIFTMGTQNHMCFVTMDTQNPMCIFLLWAPKIICVLLLWTPNIICVLLLWTANIICMYCYHGHPKSCVYIVTMTSKMIYIHHCARK